MAIRRTRKMRRQTMPLRATGMSSFSARDHQFLQRLPILLGRQTNRRAGRTSAHARGAAFDVATEIALHGNGLFDVTLLCFSEQRRDPREERFLRLFVDHEDVAVGTIALAVAAADAVALDVHLTAWIARDGIGRTVEHAQRVLALPARV